eukprot:jgi/Antlo1/2087/2069
MRMTSAAILLCICTGTGIAPFIAFARNKAEEQMLWIVFGCRNTEDDLSVDIAAADGVEISRAFSSRGEYVTDILARNEGRVEAFFCKGDVFVCGGPEMQRSVMCFIESRFGRNAAEKVLRDDWR